MSHTKAPWRAMQRAHTKGPPSTAPEDSHLDYFHIVAGVAGADGWELSGYMRPEDARLIAAAPDLLEALKLLAEETKLAGNWNARDYGWPKAIAATIAALDKASPATECSICRREHGREIVHEAE